MDIQTNRGRLLVPSEVFHCEKSLIEFFKKVIKSGDVIVAKTDTAVDYLTVEFKLLIKSNKLPSDSTVVIEKMKNYHSFGPIHSYNPFF